MSTLTRYLLCTDALDGPNEADNALESRKIWKTPRPHQSRFVLGKCKCQICQIFLQSVWQLFDEAFEKKRGSPRTLFHKVYLFENPGGFERANRGLALIAYALGGTQQCV